ncbi:uncharacterized protein N7459_007148 [Penicillium hispanicum]|uniref:uncharacterized protein n=1 Tax=Penicillium hispanicum TaxID=1080232 RepID=UPI002541C459|nr:uncharacterized protein N7459_007148 [Penicillium hispanicum]KAJ5578184.1 hypothetical protein N7459_007148 [Penicillium hispanicum]
MEQEPKRRLETLPTELIQLILSAIPNIESLEAAVLTGPRLHYAFKAFETRIVKPILSHEIAAELLHDALAVEISSQKQAWSTEELKEFLAKYCARDQQPFHVLLSGKLTQARSLIRLHNAVKFHRDRLASEVLSSNPVSAASAVSPVRPLSKAEETRIDCSLYRFQIYCNLFRDWKKIPDSFHFDQAEVFFSLFAPWENEQLACIHDYLLRIVKPVLEGFYLNSPAWVEWLLHAGSGLNGSLQFQLSCGLHHMETIAEKKTLDAQKEFLSVPENVNVNEWFLDFAMKSAEEELPEQDPIPKPSYPDTDSGPEDSWRWVPPTLRFIYNPVSAPLRQFAYVLWDRQRLEEWGFFETSFDGKAEAEDPDLAEFKEKRALENSAKTMVKKGLLQNSILDEVWEDEIWERQSETS